MTARLLTGLSPAHTLARVARRRTTLEIVLFGLALVGGAALGTAIGSAGGPFDEWGCPSERIARETFTPAESGGYKTQSEALAAMVGFFAADGDQAASEYAAAVASSSGPTRYEPDTGRLFIEDKVEVQLRFEQLPDGTWTPSEVTICGPSAPPDLASPYPTPVDDTDG